MVSKMLNSALLFIAGINILNGYDCDHYGPYPTNRCIAGFEVNCINGSDGDWDLQFFLYENQDCSGNVTFDTIIDCFDQFGGCGCGFGECDDDQLMLIELGQEIENDTNLTNSTDIFLDDNDNTTQCIEDREYPLIKDSCISSGDWLGPEDGIISVQLLCDDVTQQILYYGWRNDDCFGEPTNREPLTYLDLNLANIPCVELYCNDFDISSFNNTEILDFNTTDILDFNETDIFDLNTTELFNETETTETTGFLSTISTFFRGNTKPRNS